MSDGVEKASLKCQAEESVPAKRLFSSVLLKAMKLLAASRRAMLGSQFSQYTIGGI